MSVALRTRRLNPTAPASPSDATVVEPMYVEHPPVDEVYEEEAGRRWWPWLVGLLLLVLLIGGGAYLLGRDAGPSQVEVPNVVGADQAAAEARLSREGFQTTVVTRESQERPKGEVMGTDPAPGARLGSPSRSCPPSPSRPRALSSWPAPCEWSSNR